MLHFQSPVFLKLHCNFQDKFIQVSFTEYKIRILQVQLFLWNIFTEIGLN